MNKSTFVQKVASNYRITIPIVIRELLGIEKGIFVRVTIEKV